MRYAMQIVALRDWPYAQWTRTPFKSFCELSWVRMNAKQASICGRMSSCSMSKMSITMDAIDWIDKLSRIDYGRIICFTDGAIDPVPSEITALILCCIKNIWFYVNFSGNTHKKNAEDKYCCSCCVSYEKCDVRKYTRSARTSIRRWMVQLLCNEFRYNVIHQARHKPVILICLSLFIKSITWTSIDGYGNCHILY